MQILPITNKHMHFSHLRLPFFTETLSKQLLQPVFKKNLVFVYDWIILEVSFCYLRFEKETVHIHGSHVLG